MTDEMYLPYLNIKPSNALQQLPVPTSRDLFWRQCHFRALMNQQWQLLTSQTDHAAFDQYIDGNHNNLVFVNGFFNADLSNLGAEVQFEQVQNEDVYPLESAFYFDHLNQQVNEKKNVLTIQANNVIELHVHYIFDAADNSFISDLLELNIQDATNANVHMHYHNVQQHKVWFNQISKTHLKHNAHLNLFEYYHHNQSLHVTKHHNAYFEEHAQLNQFVLNKHFPFLYLQQHCNLEQTDAQWQVNGFYILKEKQVAMYRLLADHLMKKTTSHQFMRGLIADKAKALFDSVVKVHKGSCGSESTQMNNNLLLSDFANIQSFPILEIDEDDVVCSHGSTIGALDEAMLFYLQSRGLSVQQSFSLMKQAFISEVIQNFVACDDSSILQSYVKKDHDHD